MTEREPYTPSLSAWPTPSEVRETFARGRDRIAFDRMLEAVRQEEREKAAQIALSSQFGGWDIAARIRVQGREQDRG